MNPGGPTSEPAFLRMCCIEEGISPVLRMLGCSTKASRVVKRPHNIVGKTGALKSEDLCLRPASYKLY